MSVELFVAGTYALTGAFISNEKVVGGDEYSGSKINSLPSGSFLAELLQSGKRFRSGGFGGFLRLGFSDDDWFRRSGGGFAWGVDA